MKRIFVLAFGIVAFLTVVAQNDKINTLSEKEKKEGWQLLFNGKDLNGWRTFQGKEISGWKVIDGVLNNSGVGSDHGGDIITKAKFQNFELSLEWKIAPQSNSGIFYHVNEKIGTAIYESGPEYQLIDDKGWPDRLRDDQHSGANYGMHAPKNAVVKDSNEWNQTRIVVEGTHVQHYLNGVKVVDYQLWDNDWLLLKEKGKWKDYPYYGMARKGPIGLQDHGGLAQFRNIKIKVIK
ncbi:MAG: DUF1080 domain-containing protein [Prolixibacteraceae bacterium]|nr:DUF1080 domain-containing protein [Prolixibacteraceae bacterium]